MTGAVFRSTPVAAAATLAPALPASRSGMTTTIAATAGIPGHPGEPGLRPGKRPRDAAGLGRERVPADAAATLP